MKLEVAYGRNGGRPYVKPVYDPKVPQQVTRINGIEGRK